MNLNVTTYFKEEFKFEGHNFKLYHEWIYDKIFHDLPIDKDTADLIKLAIFKASWGMLWASEVTRVPYEHAVLRRAKMPSGELEGQIIYDLPSERHLIPLLIPWTKTKNEIVAKAARNKIQSIELHADE